MNVCFPESGQVETVARVLAMPESGHSNVPMGFSNMTASDALRSVAGKPEIRPDATIAFTKSDFKIED